jgi:hypothetical protein
MSQIQILLDVVLEISAALDLQHSIHLLLVSKLSYDEVWLRLQVTYSNFALDRRAKTINLLGLLVEGPEKDN